MTPADVRHFPERPATPAFGSSCRVRTTATAFPSRRDWRNGLAPNGRFRVSPSRTEVRWMLGVRPPQLADAR